jgi:hypothetical protein
MARGVCVRWIPASAGMTVWELIDEGERCSVMARNLCLFNTLFSEERKAAKSKTPLD